ncbi:unnamed protein product [Sphacelaria rigidula]
MFPDASECHWGSLVMQVPTVEIQMPVRAVALYDADVQSFESDFGTAILHSEGLFRVHGRNVLWIPSSDKQLQVRLMVCTHMRDAGHRGVAATLVRLQTFRVWQGIETHVGEFIRQCLHCADSGVGDVVPRPLGETVHGTIPNEVVHFNFLYGGESGPLASLGLSEDACNFVALEPVAVYC